MAELRLHTWEDAEIHQTTDYEPRKIFSERKKVQYVWIDTGGLRRKVPVLHPLCSLNYFMGYFVQVLFGQSF